MITRFRSKKGTLLHIKYSIQSNTECSKCDLILLYVVIYAYVHFVCTLGGDQTGKLLRSHANKGRDPSTSFY